MIGTLILWGCIIWIVPLMYVLLRNEAKWKKNIVVGATLPYEARQDPEVEETLRRYQRQLGWMSVLLLLVTVPCMFVPRFSVQFILWSFWLLLAMVCCRSPLFAPTRPCGGSKWSGDGAGSPPPRRCPILRRRLCL